MPSFVLFEMDLVTLRIEEQPYISLLFFYQAGIILYKWAQR